MLESYAKRDERIVIGENVKAKDKKYVVVLNDNDEYSPSFLSELTAFIEKNKLEAAFCGYDLIQAKRSRFVSESDLIITNGDFESKFLEYSAFIGNNLPFICRSELWNGEYNGLNALERSGNFGVLAKSLFKRVHEIETADDKVRGAVNRIGEMIDFLGARELDTQANVETIYNEYIDALIPVIEQNSFTPQAVIEVCKCPYTIFPGLWENYSNTDKLIAFLNRFTDVMLSLDETDINSDDIDIFCRAGELMSGSADNAEKWLQFKKLKAQLLLNNLQIDEADGALNELEKLVPADNSVKALRARFGKIIKYSDVEINDIYDFSEYLDWLDINKKRYTIIIVSLDTPWGPNFTPRIIEKFMSLGLKVNLNNQFRYGYIGIIDGGETIYEQLTPRGVAAKWSGKIGDADVQLESRGYEVVPFTESQILINGNNYSNKERGLNIVIYDKENDTIIDDVTFDAFSDELVCLCPYRLIYKLRTWHENHPEIGLIRLIRPKFPSQNRSACEQEMVDNFTKGYHLIHAKQLAKKFYNDEIIEECTATIPAYLDSDGVRHLQDTKRKYYNVSGGHRVTTDCPDEFKRTIYLAGGCRILGSICPDSDTIPSMLQRLCNKNIPEELFRVQNYGYGLAEVDRKRLEELRIIEALPLKAGDILICDWGGDEFIIPDLPTLDLSRLSERPHNYGEIFYDAIPHFNPDGNRVIAEKIFERLKQEKFFSDLILSDVKTIAQDLELNKYKKHLTEIYDSSFSVGSIVMNCNPFTLGHHYLIEQAAKQCGHLVVFVVEEDKSIFKFEDRFALVKAGTSDIENVTVIPSGQFVLSSLTFTEYFNKSELQDRFIDASNDVNIFAREIAPCLHITKRFVGTEPFDTVTKQYNNDMKAILPQHGIEVIEIPRLKKDGLIISASEVRRSIISEELQNIRSIVPDTTFSFICENLELLKKRLNEI